MATAKKSARQLDREIAESLKKVEEQFGPKFAAKAAERLAARPKTFPKRLRHGGYTATFQGIKNERFPGDSIASAQWEIKRGDKVVGHMFEGAAYGWGRPHSSMNQLVWAGKMPEDASDARSANYGILFDQGPVDSHKEALANFARAADRLIAWRHKHGYAAYGYTREGKAKRTTARGSR